MSTKDGILFPPRILFLVHQGIDIELLHIDKTMYIGIGDFDPKVFPYGRDFELVFENLSLGSEPFFIWFGQRNLVFVCGLLLVLCVALQLGICELLVYWFYESFFKVLLPGLELESS